MRRLVSRLRASLRRHRGLLPILALCGVAATHADCNCSHSAASACKLDDDCRATRCPTSQLPVCQQNMCTCTPDTPIGDIGRFSTMALSGSTAYVAAYNNTYGDLMIGHVTPPGVVKNWEFVDGVPLMSASDDAQSQVRGGITDPGDDVGRYTSIQITPAGDPVVAYYDATHGALRYASFGAVLWHSHAVDHGTGNPQKGGDDVGRYAALTLAHDGTPGIAYYAEVAVGASGQREGQLRWAQAKTPTPSSASDWTITVIETRPIAEDVPGPDGGAPAHDVVPGGIALFCAAARKADDTPVIAYYDRERGNLRYVEWDPTANAFGTPIILDGEDQNGNDTADVGWYPSVYVDGNVSHISYVDASHDNLLYVNTMDKTPEVVDDGYRPMDEMTQDGLPAPVFHLVGDSSSIQVVTGQVYIAYQDSTIEQLRFAARDSMTGKWVQIGIAGHGSPFHGSYGFYAQNRISGGVAVLSSYAINNQAEVPAFWVETFAVNLGTVM